MERGAILDQPRIDPDHLFSSFLEVKDENYLQGLDIYASWYAWKLYIC